MYKLEKDLVMTGMGRCKGLILLAAVGLCGSARAEDAGDTIAVTPPLTIEFVDEPTSVLVESSMEFAEPVVNDSGLGAPIAEEATDGLLNEILLGDELSSRTGVHVDGWIEGGVTINDGHYPGNRLFGSTGLPDNYLAPLVQGVGANNPVRFNDLEGFQMNQLYVKVARALRPDSDHIDFGFEIDTLYGTDARFVTATGWDDRLISASDSLNYRLAVPQANVQLFLPIHNGITVKTGHFYTLLGYEATPAPANFFYSHSYAFSFGQPFTHTGTMFSCQLCPSILIESGIVRGWDNFSDNNNGWSYLGRFTWSPSEKKMLSFAIITGPEHNEPDVGTEGPDRRMRWMYTVVYRRRVWEKLWYLMHHHYGFEADGSRVAPSQHAEWYGISQQLVWSLTDKLALGLRGEWFRDDDGARVAGVRATDPGIADSFYEITLGANYQPRGFLTLRPEVRWDWQNADSGAEVFNGGLSRRQFTAAVDMLLRF